MFLRAESFKDGQLRDILQGAPEDMICKIYTGEGMIVRKTFVNIFERDTRDGDVTLVTQMSFERMHRLPKILAHWEGEIACYLVAERCLSSYNETVYVHASQIKISTIINIFRSQMKVSHSLLLNIDRSR